MSGTLSVPSLPTSLPGMIVLFYDQEKTDPPCVFRVLPVVLIMVPFGVIAKEYRIVHDANDCSCWYCLYNSHAEQSAPLVSFRCLPFFGNVIPRPNLLNPDTSTVRKYGQTSFVLIIIIQEQHKYLRRLQYFIASYSVVLIINYTFVLCCMAVVYYKAFRRIRRMIHTQGINFNPTQMKSIYQIFLSERNENTPLYGATQAMILEGQRDAKRRVLLFFFSYILTGGMSEVVVSYNNYSNCSLSPQSWCWE